MAKAKLDKGMRYNKNGTIEAYGVIHNRRGDTINYSFTRDTKDEILDMKAKIRLLGNVDNDVVRIKIGRNTDNIEFIRSGQTKKAKETNVSNKMLVREYVDYYLFEHRVNGERGRKIENTTLATYIDKAQYIKDYIGDIRVAELSVEDIDNFINRLQKDGRADTTCRQVRDMITTMCKYMKKDGLTEINILQDDKITLKERKGKAVKRIIQQEDIATFVNFCKEHNYNDLIFLLYTGVRGSEMAGVTWKDIDFEKRNSRN